ncbi:MAG TPA: hypothetical protein V6D17_05400 [Candidatus Obscuribacterales bacterium]
MMVGIAICLIALIIVCLAIDIRRHRLAAVDKAKRRKEQEESFSLDAFQKQLKENRYEGCAKIATLASLEQQLDAWALCFFNADHQIQELDASITTLAKELRVLVHRVGQFCQAEGRDAVVGARALNAALRRMPHLSAQLAQSCRTREEVDSYRRLAMAALAQCTSKRLEDGKRLLHEAQTILEHPPLLRIEKSHDISST